MFTAVKTGRLGRAMEPSRESSRNVAASTRWGHARSRRAITLLVALWTLSTALSSSAGEPIETPQYGGELNVGTVNLTISALSWDIADWSWKITQDAGPMQEQLFVGDLDQSLRKGGKYSFRLDAYIPEAAMAGELAERWEWEDPLTLVVYLRKGIFFPDKPGVMRARELDADDVVFSFATVNESAKRIPAFIDHIDQLEARDKYTVVFHFASFNTEWAYRYGYGYFSSIIPRETAQVDRKDWRMATGTGPFTLERYTRGNSHRYARQPNYWAKETVGDQQYQIPFVDYLNYRIIKDESTYLAALRTAKIDILENVRWIAIDHLKQTTPELKWSRSLTDATSPLVLRVDQKPFDDVRVRRALNLAVNQQELVDLFFGGHAELMAYPQHPGFGRFYQPLDEMPESVQELFSYNPKKAKQLLVDAGYAKGFSFKVQVCTCDESNMELLPLLVSYFSDIDVQLEIEPMEYASFLSLMTTRSHGPGYLMVVPHGNPTTSLRKNFEAGQMWNPSMFADPAFDAKVSRMLQERDEDKRIALVREMTIEILDQAPYVWMPTGYTHTAWWPWVKNYNGELFASAGRASPIYARIWIDQKMKRDLGF